MMVEAGGERQASENSESLQDNPEGWKRSDYEEARESSYVDHIITTQRLGLSQHYVKKSMIIIIILFYRMVLIMQKFF